MDMGRGEEVRLGGKERVERVAWKHDSLKRTLMLGKIEARRRRGATG